MIQTKTSYVVELSEEQARQLYNLLQFSTERFTISDSYDELRDLFEDLKSIFNNSSSMFGGGVR